MGLRSEMKRFARETGPVAREMVNDVRGTLHQVMFGQPETPGALGTPMQPTPGMVDDRTQPKGQETQKSKSRFRGRDR